MISIEHKDWRFKISSDVYDRFEAPGFKHVADLTIISLDTEFESEAEFISVLSELFLSTGKPLRELPAKAAQVVDELDLCNINVLSGKTKHGTFSLMCDMFAGGVKGYSEVETLIKQIADSNQPIRPLFLGTYRTHLMLITDQLAHPVRLKAPEFITELTIISPSIDHDVLVQIPNGIRVNIDMNHNNTTISRVQDYYRAQTDDLHCIKKEYTYK